MSILIMPDLQAFISQFARAQAEVVALIGQRAYTEIPPNATYPLVRFTDIGGGGRSGHAHWQQQGLIQTDVWGGPSATAARIAETLRSVFKDRLPGQHLLEDGTRIVVTSVDPERPRRGADTKFPGNNESSSKPHASFDTVVNFHP